MKNIKIVSLGPNLFSAIISLVLGVILFSRPDLVTIVISYVVGIILLVYGLGKIIYFSYQKGKDSATPLNDVISGIILIIVGLVCIFLSDVIEQIVRFIIGIIILLVGINRLIKTLNMQNKKDSTFWAALVTSLILIGGSLYVIFYSNLLFSGLGIVLIVYAFLEIINYILFYNENKMIYPESSNVEPPKEEIKTIEVKETKNKKKEKKKKQK